MSKASKPPNSGKPYHMMYVQQLEHLPAGDVDSLEKLIEMRVRPKEFALIVHDKDIDEEPHIHCMLSFKNGRSINSVAKLLGDRPQYVEKWDDKPNNGFAYLIHATAKAQSEGKYQYNPAEVRANFDYSARIEQIKVEIETAKAKHNTGKKIDGLLDLLYVGAITKKEAENQLTGAQYAQYHRKIEDVWAKHLQNRAETWRKEMRAKGAQVQVIWIYGPAGTGKTSLAKSYAQKVGQDYYISGSTRDPFQGYGGEHTLILDELRPKVIAYHDLLRILDPFSLTDVTMAPSRYSDRAVACDLIVITTPYDPLSFYKTEFNTETGLSGIDSFDQLLRRLTLVVHMSSDEMEVMAYDLCGFQSVPGTVTQNLYSAKNRPTPKVDKMDIYRSMLDSASPVADSSPKNEITATAVAAPLKNQNEGGGE